MGIPRSIRMGIQCPLAAYLYRFAAAKRKRAAGRSWHTNGRVDRRDGWSIHYMRAVSGCRVFTGDLVASYLSAKCAAAQIAGYPPQLSLLRAGSLRMAASLGG